MLKIDLHTHSSASPDGGITQDDYIEMLESGQLDYVAITDHDRIDFAKNMQKIMGDKIIVGQEVTTAQGELIGLFLSKKVKPHQSLAQTAMDIKEQGGLVYVPHPFETVRKGVKQTELDGIDELVDIVEVFNGRAVAQNKGPKAATWARLHQKPGAASSDAHGRKGVGFTYSQIEEKPDVHNLVAQLITAHLHATRPPLHTLLYPKLHRLKKKLGRA